MIHDSRACTATGSSGQAPIESPVISNCSSIDLGPGTEHGSREVPVGEGPVSDLSIHLRQNLDPLDDLRRTSMNQNDPVEETQEVKQRRPKELNLARRSSRRFC